MDSCLLAHFFEAFGVLPGPKSAFRTIRRRTFRKLFFKRHFRGKTAVESILPDTLQEFLDEDCISGKGVVTAEEFSITFDYGFLAPPLLNEKMALPSDEQEVS